MNGETLEGMKDIGLSLFAATCGKNRGAFVLDPPDGHTYSCLSFPENFQEIAGVDELNDSVVINEVNAINLQYKAGNFSSKDTVKMLDLLVKSVYYSTPNKDADPYACEFNGLAKLSCDSIGSPRSDDVPIRSVTLSGLFVPALWATDGHQLSLEEAEEWYTLKDFEAMKAVGLNTVQIPVPTATFTPKDKYGARVKDILQSILNHVDEADLQAILALVGTADENDAVVAGARYASSQKSVLGLTLPSETTLDPKTLIAEIRVESPTLPIFVPVSEGDLIRLKNKAEFGSHVYGSLKVSHSKTIADIASSTSVEDRSKMFYHEATSCVKRSPIEFSSCMLKLPVFLSSGFDLSIDNCILQNNADNFVDYGQCNRFFETIDSKWWKRHRQSLAARQLYAYEQGLGWSFSAWKLYNNVEPGVIDSPEKLLSLRDVVAAGLFPDLTDYDDYKLACLNPPVSDFILGDATLAPTMGPPPDCGNGWWNYSTSKCDYWIPPPPTASPTPCLTEACPVCSPQSSSITLTNASLGGVAIVMVMSYYFFQKRRTEYTAIPN